MTHPLEPLLTKYGFKFQEAYDLKIYGLRAEKELKDPLTYVFERVVPLSGHDRDGNCITETTVFQVEERYISITQYLTHNKPFLTEFPNLKDTLYQGRPGTEEFVEQLLNHVLDIEKEKVEISN